MPLHTGFHPTCAVAFCPIYDTARQNFASKVRRSSWENHLFRFTYCAMKPLLTQFSLSEASRNGLHNGIERDDFPTTTSQPTPTNFPSQSS